MGDRMPIAVTVTTTRTMPAAACEEEEDEASDAVDESDDDDVDDGDDDDESTTKPAPASSEPPEPISVTIKTATGSKLLDQSIELPTVTRTRDVASLKKSVSRQLPSRPPIAAIQLTLNGKILEDNTVVEDLVDEEDEDDEEDAEGEGLVLQLDMLPTVDPKFVADLEKKIPDMTTAELLEAYTINEAAVYQNSVMLMKEEEKQQHHSEAGSEDDEEQLERPAAAAAPQPVSAHIREQAARIRQNLESTVLQTSNAQQVLSDPLPPLSAAQKQRSAVVEVKGQRVRQPGTSGGVQGGWKRVIQHNLNVNWAVTIRHFLLFLFFGYFGGRTASSRAILLLGAPSVFVLQFRPVKLLLRQMAYAVLDHPPSILLSLLPAPQQTILSLNVNEAIDAIYGEHIVGSTSIREEEETEDDVESLEDFDDEEEEEEYDSEDEYDEDDSDDDY